MSGPAVVVAGNLNVDLTLAHVPDWPKWGTEVVLERADRRAGGVAHAACALAALGVAVTVVAAVGQDADAAFLRSWLARAGVDASGVAVHPERATGLSVAVVRADGERTFFTLPGALLAEAPADLLARAGAFRPRWLLLSGLMLLPDGPPEPIVAEMARLSRLGTRVAVDVGWDPLGWPPRRLHLARSVLEAADLALLNADEARALGWEDARPRRSGAKVAVKRGPLGARVGDDGGGWDVPATPAVAVDTVGAGDVWNAAFLAASLAGQSAVPAAARANRVAALYVAAPPGPDRYPSRERLEPQSGEPAAPAG
ncbi:MAG: carbohydrate kinase family protein [Firmicutes bacterium]|nr:carbohydrate kinase family protein [Bacillota bacterium]